MTSPILTEIMDAAPTLSDEEVAQIEQVVVTLWANAGADDRMTAIQVLQEMAAPLAIVITAGLAVLEK